MDLDAYFGNANDVMWVFSSFFSFFAFMEKVSCVDNERHVACSCKFTLPYAH